MKKSELKEFIKSEITSTLGEGRREEAIQDLKMLLQDLEVKGDEARQIVKDIDPNEARRLEQYGAFNLGWSPNKYDTTLQSFYQELTGEDGEMYEQGMATVDDADVTSGKVDVSKLNKSGIDVKITEDDDETDKQATKAAKKGGAKGKKLDLAIKDLRRIEKNMKSELEIYKTSEGEKAKNAAKKRLKDLTDEKKEAKALIKRLEGNVIK